MRDMTGPLRMFVVPGAALLDVQQNSGNACVWCPRTLHLERCHARPQGDDC
ncbi:hypothetical protein [Streptomyces aureocirculatus]|uniref:hypothetical protein n=1 Tax=Streptomyces aureocirculatus TaxID=67275 RepID=UPI0012FEADF9|nr:hypothetical protein [Streptomyces aureocirculatus]